MGSGGSCLEICSIKKIKFINKVKKYWKKFQVFCPSAYDLGGILVASEKWALGARRPALGARLG